MSLRPDKSPCRGFTLLELILALALTVIVLMIVSTGIGVQLRAFDRNRERVECAQLARALLHRMADDLRGAFPPPEKSSGEPSSEGDASSDSETAEESDTGELEDSEVQTSSIGLCGEADWLRIDVLRAVPIDASSSGTAEGGDSTTQTLRQIQTVVYYVIPPEEPAGELAGSDSEEPTNGLVRRELVGPTANWAAEHGSLEYQDLSVPPLPSTSKVMAVEFRYHDGEDWVESWDSSESGSLPKAIEIRLFLSGKITTGVTASQAAGAVAEAPDVEYRLIVPFPLQGGSGSSGSASVDDLSSELPDESDSSTGSEAAADGGVPEGQP